MVLKSVLITGCGPGGIGASIARAMHLRGHRVFATGRTEDEIDRDLAPLGLQTFLLDVTDIESIQQAVETVQKSAPSGLDILIHNAGALHVMPVADTDVADVRRLFEVNVFAVYTVTQAFLPLLMQAKGLIAAPASINSVFCPTFLGTYNASKAALEALLRTMRRELQPLGIRVTILKTGSVQTKLFDNAPKTVLPEGSLYTPVKDWVQDRGFLADARFISVEEYAETVTKAMLTENTKSIIWAGGLVWLAWLLSWFGWETMMDKALIDGSGLQKVRVEHQ